MIKANYSNETFAIDYNGHRSIIKKESTESEMREERKGIRFVYGIDSCHLILDQKNTRFFLLNFIKLI